MSIQLAMWLYQNHRIISIVEKGTFIDFNKEKDLSTVAAVKGSVC
ncbi:hypothetical protein [Anaerosolibacter sp.]|jgi:hypothetical protein|nr:hypothetical protein [Anaerosolibacter sp.]